MATDMKWAPRVSRSKLKELYVEYAGGTADEALVDDVGLTLLLRCRDILAVDEARKGRVRCPSCHNKGRSTTIQRSDSMECPECGWQSAWADFASSFKRQQLNSGGALGSFRDFVEAYPRAGTIKEKMGLIDRLIHEYHYSLKEDPSIPTRSVGPNLIDANLTQVMAFLNELTYGRGEGCLPQETLERWNANAAKWESWLEGYNKKEV